MGNLVIAWDDKTQVGTYSGGSWDGELSLNNLKNYDPKRLARSVDDSEASTTFVVDLGLSIDVGIAALINSNLSDAATARLRVGPNADGSSALIDVTLTAGDFGTYTPSTGRSIFHVATTAVTARYVLWNISDVSNADGYVQFGRHIAGPVFQPDINIIYGAQLSLIDNSRQSRSVDFSLYSDIVPKRRRLSASFDLLTDDEAYDQVYEMQNDCGTTVPIFVVKDPALTGNALQRNTIYGHLLDISPITARGKFGSAAMSAWQFVVEERP